MRNRRFFWLSVAAPCALAPRALAQPIVYPATPGARTSGSSAAATLRPFGTLREMATKQQRWLELRMERTLPTLMRRAGVDMWVVPMREYAEDPLFTAITSPTTFAARRRTIYVFFDKGPKDGVEKLALGGTSQGNIFKAVRSMKAVPAPAAGSRSNDRTAELWGDEQWSVLKQVIEERQPKKIAVNTSRTFAFADGLSSGEREGMLEALGAPWAAKIVNAEIVDDGVPAHERKRILERRALAALTDHDGDLTFVVEVMAASGPGHVCLMV